MAQFDADILFSVKSKNVTQVINKIESGLTKVNNRVNVLSTNLDAASNKLKNLRIPDKNFALAAKQVSELNKKLSRSVELQKRFKAVTESRAARLAGGRTVGTRVRRSELAAGRDIAQGRGEQAAFNRIISDLEANIKKTAATTQKAAAAEAKRKRAIDKTTEANKRAEKSAKSLADKTAATRRRNTFKGGLEGVGFPLLFGAGPGAVLGGGLGGLAGGAAGLGFGAQALGTAAGTAIDNFARSAAELGQALNPLTADLTKITKATGDANSQFEKFIKQLEELGKEEDALRLATAKLAAVVGQDGVDALRQYGNSTNELSQEFSKAMTIMGAALADFINKTGIISGLTGSVTESNALAAAQTSTNPEIQRLTNELNSLQGTGTQGGDLNETLKRRVELREQIIELQQEAADVAEAEVEAETRKLAIKAEQAQNQKTELDDAYKKLRLVEADLAVIQSGTDLTNEAAVATRRQRIETEYLLERDKERVTTGTTLVALKNRELKLAELQAAVSAATERANDKAAREAEKAAREAERFAERQAQALQRLSQLQVDNSKKSLDYDVERARLSGGEVAALAERYKQSQQILDNEIAALDLQKERLRKQFEGLGFDEELTRILSTQKELKINQVNLEQTLVGLKLAKALAEEKSRKEIEAQSRALRLQQSRSDLESAQLTLANPFGGADLQRGQQLIQQQIELETLRLENSKKSAAAEAELAGTGKGTQAAIDAQQKLDLINAENEELERNLLLRQEVEQAILNQQLALQKFSGVQSALASGLSSIMSSAVQDIVTGTSTVQEAFGNMFKAIGQAFLDMVAQILAQKAVLMLLKAFQPTPSPSLGSGALNIGLAAGNPVQLASGGYVTRPTPALIGEAGEPEYVIPASKMSGAAQAYNAGARGDDVLSGSHLFSTYNAGNNGGTIFVESTVINNVEYVTMDQARAMTKEAAASGAQRGHGRTMNVLQHSRGQRSRIGMS